MKALVTKKVEIEIDIKTVLIKAHVRHWDDAEVNGEEDTDGKLIPCRNGDLWCPVIDIETGVILNWEMGVEAKVNYKIGDSGSYYLQDENGEIVSEIIDDYVPNDLIPGDYGDYIFMKIDKTGKILNWPNPISLEEFF